MEIGVLGNMKFYRSAKLYNVFSRYMLKEFKFKYFKYN